MTFTVHLFCFRHTCKTFNILTALYFIMTTFTHINSQGEANMVDVSAKAETVREARDYVKRNPCYDRGRQTSQR